MAEQRRIPLSYLVLGISAMCRSAADELERALNLAPPPASRRPRRRSKRQRARARLSSPRGLRQPTTPATKPSAFRQACRPFAVSGQKTLSTDLRGRAPPSLERSPDKRHRGEPIPSTSSRQG